MLFRSYVFDKGYTDYRWWAEIIEANALFVTRRKKNACCREVSEQPAVGDGILAERRLKIGHRRPHAGAGTNPLYQIELREIVVARPDKDQPLYLLTNDFERPAAEIAPSTRSVGTSSCCSSGSSRTSKSAAFSGAAKMR